MQNNFIFILFLTKKIHHLLSALCRLAEIWRLSITAAAGTICRACTLCTSLTVTGICWTNFLTVWLARCSGRHSKRHKLVPADARLSESQRYCAAWNWFHHRNRHICCHVHRTNCCSDIVWSDWTLLLFLHSHFLWCNMAA